MMLLVATLSNQRDNEGIAAAEEHHHMTNTKMITLCVEMVQQDDCDQIFV